jgi:hypothetical protein
MAGKPKQNMVPHLCKCIYVDPATKTHAQSARAEADESRPGLSHSASWSHMLQPPASTWPGGPSTSATPSPLPSPLLFNTSLPLLKRRRTSSVFEESRLLPSWTSTVQSEFGEDLCKLFVAIRAPWNSANNPQMHIFFQKWVPGAIIPDRRTLSGPILDREAAKVEESLKSKLQGRLATFTTDGWKNKAKQSIVASMVSVGSEVN